MANQISEAAPLLTPLLAWLTSKHCHSPAAHTTKHYLHTVLHYYEGALMHQGKGIAHRLHPPM